MTSSYRGRIAPLPNRLFAFGTRAYFLVCHGVRKSMRMVLIYREEDLDFQRCQKQV